MIYLLDFSFLLLRILMFVAIVLLIYSISKDAINLARKHGPGLSMFTATEIKINTIFACFLSFMLGIMITISFIFNNITII
jgi:hypothetical protein